MVTLFSYLLLAIFFAISLYVLVGMLYLGFKTWKEDKTKVRKMRSGYGAHPKDGAHPIAS